MRSGLFILPFLAIFTAAVFASLSSSFPALGVAFKSIGLGLTAGLVALWIWLDRTGFQKFFARKGAKYGASSGAVLILALSVFIALGVITSRPRFDKTFDLSRDKTNTLSDQTIKAIETLAKKDVELKVIAFFSEGSSQPDQASQPFRDLIGLYLARGAKMSIEYVNPDRDNLRANAEKLTSANTVIFKLGQQENRITTFTEEKITNALIAVLKEGSKKIYFTTGHGEGQLAGSEAEGFDLINQELKNNRFEVANINILDTGKIPGDASVVVIAGPKYDLKDLELNALNEYVSNGGSLFAMIDALTPVTNINKLLNRYGLSFDSDFVILRPDDPNVRLMGQNNAIVADFDEFSPVTKDFARKSNVAVLFQNTRTVSEITNNEAKFKVSLIGKTAGSTTVKVKNVNSKTDLGGITPDRLEQGSFAVMGTATGKAENKEVRIAAFGSAQFATNKGAQLPEHRDLLMNSMSWLTQDDDFIAIRPRDLTKSTLNMATGSATLNLLFISYIYPFIFLGFGTFYWLRRKQA